LNQTMEKRTQTGPRLFDAGPGDAHDYSSFCTALANHQELRGLRDADEIRQRTTCVRELTVTLSALALTQAACAAVFATTLLIDLASGADDSAAILTTTVIFGSGCVGLIGGFWRSTWALQSFFLTQIWTLALVFAQWLRSQQQFGRVSIFCHQHVSGAGGHQAGCAAATDAAQLAAIVLSLVVVYASMFVSDVLAERLQDEREREDQVALVRFSWLMHRKTLVGVQRFEEVIHQRFEELVQMGFLRRRR